MRVPIDIEPAVAAPNATEAGDTAAIVTQGLENLKGQWTGLDEAGNGSNGVAATTPDTATVGEIIQYEITTTVPEGTTVYDATVTDTLPAGVTSFAGTALLDGTVSDLQPTVTVTGGNRDGDEDDHDLALIRIREVDLAVEKVGEPNIRSGTDTTWTITVSNDGPDEDPGPVTAGDSASPITVTTNVTASTGAISNSASVTTEASDSVATNDTDAAAATVVAAPKGPLASTGGRVAGTALLAMLLLSVGVILTRTRRRLASE